MTHSVTEPRCCYCGGPNMAARVTELGYLHCPAPSCVAAWRRGKVADSGLALVFMHKQGLQWIKREQVPDNDLRRSGGQR